MCTHDRYRFRPRVLRDVSKVDIRVKIQGDEVGSPIDVSPTAMQKMAHIEGEAATAQGKLHYLASWFMSCWFMSC